MKQLSSSLLLVSVCFAATAASIYPPSTSLIQPRLINEHPYQPKSLCSADEHIIFSCTVKRVAKVVSLCGSKDLAKDQGYLQYRFGLPGKVELEFPKDRKATQQQFHYSHYFRAQVDLTEINFNIEGYAYQIFDAYNGEEKPPIKQQGVSVTAPRKTNDVSYYCRSQPTADYGMLTDVLVNDQE